MSRPAPALLALLAAAMLLPALLPAADPRPKEEPLVEQVRTAIDTGVRFLRKEERGQGNWEHGLIASNKPGGFTSLALLALLNCGVKPDDPLIQRGLEWLRKLELRDTYVVGLQTMVFAEVNDPRDLTRIQRNVDWLVRARSLRGDKLHGWGYDEGARLTDNSNSQYALLGLNAGRQAGAKIDRALWESIFRYYADDQEPDGGWIYSRDYAPRGTTLTMTIAGLCGLYIAGEELDAGRRHLRPDGSDPDCGKYPENEPIRRGLDWLAGQDRFGNTRFRFEDRDGHTFYNIYGIERAGRYSGQRFLAGHDWYREGCDWLVRRQHEDGSWYIGAGAGGVDTYPVLSTSFALLFLSKGRTPVLISKFAYGRPDGPELWNNKHHDARHLTEYASTELFKRRPLAWQVYDPRRVNLARRDVLLEEVGHLLQSPVLYLNGHESPLRTLTDAQQQLLKRYVEEGGFLFAEACCNSADFRAGFRQLMAQLLPDTKLEPLRPDHPIWTAHAPVPPGFAGLEGIELGCKTVVVFSPQALAGYWELNQYQPRTAHVPDTDRATLAFRLAGNVIAYATGLEVPPPRLTEVAVADDRAERRSPRGFLQAAQVRHEGDWQPAPRALPNLMRFLRAEHRLDVALQREEVRLDDPNLFLFKFLYLHGRRAFDVPPAGLENLRANLKAGGLLFADACCGRKEFDRAFRAFAAKLFPDARLEPIPVADALYSAEVNGAAVTSVRVRKERPGGAGAEAEYREAPPFLEGVRLNGRWAVIYSKYDIGCALENHQSSDCLGHDKASALRLGAAAVLYALKK
jgi:hypothetical protein